MPEARHPHIKVENVDGIAVVRFVGADTMYSELNIQIVGDQLYSLVEDEGYAKLLLDFSAVEIISSLMFGKLKKLKEKVKEKDEGRFIICGLNETMREVFKITRFDRVFEIHDDEQAALDELRGAP
jgi:anti-sigma B factor antagonist